MAKKKTDWARMVKYGQWLESILHIETKNWDLLRLLQEAVDLLGIKYDIPADHPFISYLDMLTEQNIQWRAFPNFIELIKKSKINDNHISVIGETIYENLYSPMLHTARMLENINNNDIPWSNTFYNVMKKTNDIDKEEYTKSIINNFIELQIIEKDLIQLDLDRQYEFIINLYDDFHFSDKLDKISQKIELFNTKELDLLEETLDNIYCMAKAPSPTLINNPYSGVGEHLIIDKNGCRKIKVLLTVNKNGEITPLYTTPHTQPIPFKMFISRIFFEFMLLGGQNYFGFCNYCHGFYIAERKGRKKFCSDVCRTMNQRK